MHTILHPVVFTPDPQIELQGGPRFSNTAMEDSNRDAQSNINWDAPKWEWTMQFVGDKALMSILTAFQLARQGTAYGWLIRDPYDDRASASDGDGWILTAEDGKRYLTKLYDDDYAPYERRIRCPVLGTVVASPPLGTLTVNAYTGEVTGATGDGPCSFEFYCPVRFASDFMPLNRQPGDAGSTWQILVQEIGKFLVAT